MPLISQLVQLAVRAWQRRCRNAAQRRQHREQDLDPAHHWPD